MRDQCGIIFRQAKRDLETAGGLNNHDHPIATQQSNHEEIAASDVDRELLSLQTNGRIIGVELIAKLEELLIKSQTLKHGLARAKRVKLIRGELNKARKLLATTTDSSQSDGENEIETKTVVLTPTTTTTTVATTTTTTKSASSSPSGVNRRTAVLFTRKAQAALKKPDDSEKENKQ